MLHPMEILKEKLNEILEVLPPNSRIVYLDYPVYGNIGDLLIMSGTENFFAEHNINVISRFCFLEYPQLKIPSNTILVFQGGGNFGDLYLQHQKMREHFIKNYRDHRIVILPQTIYFHDIKNLESSAQIFQKHQDLHIFVRDKRSLKIAKHHFADNVYLSPDMAHFLWPIKCSSFKSDKILFLQRIDKEAKFNIKLYYNKEKFYVIDWPELIGKLEHRLIWSIIKMYRANRIISIFPTRFVWYSFSQYLINKAIKLFSRYPQIITSRLHGHILACLMGIPNILLDNSYGKNKMYYKTWTFRIPYASFKEDFREVVI